MSERNEFPKLLKKEYKILELLIAGGEMFGLEMVEDSEGEPLDICALHLRFFVGDVGKKSAWRFG